MCVLYSRVVNCKRVEHVNNILLSMATILRSKRLCVFRCNMFVCFARSAIDRCGFLQLGFPDRVFVCLFSVSLLCLGRRFVVFPANMLDNGSFFYFIACYYC